MKPGKFLGILKLDWENRTWWRLSQDPNNKFAYVTATGLIIEPPDQMKTDLGSVPRFFWRFIFPTEFSPAFVIHDWLYHCQILSRRRADQILCEGILTLTLESLQKSYEQATKCPGDLLLLLVGRFIAHTKRFMIYWTLRAFGWIAWRKKYKNNS